MQDQLNKAFAALNADMLARQLAWGAKRRDATLALIAELAPKRRSMGEFRYYDAIFDAAGGKTWFSLLTASEWEPSIHKNVAALIAKRDAKIIASLEKVGITAIPDFDLVHVSDGFEGEFFIHGFKVTIRTILAGGYNIQCLHQRTLVKVR